MRNLMLGVVVLAGCVDQASESSTEQAAQIVVDVVTANGGGASLHATNPAPWRYYHLDAFEYGTGPTKGAYLMFFGTVGDESTLICDNNPFPFPWPMCSYTRFTTFFGMGPITGLQLSPRAASLNATIGANMHAEQCVTDTLAGTYECTSLTGQTIDLRWQRSNEFFSSMQAGTTEQSMGRYTFRTVGTTHNSGASASGTLAGHSIDGMGFITSTRGAYVSKSVLTSM